MEVLKLIQGDNVAALSQTPDQFGKITQIGNALRSTESFQVAIASRDDTDWVRIWDLQVERSGALLCSECLLDQGCLANAAPAGDLEKKPTATIKDRPQKGQLSPSAVKTPSIHHAQA